VGGEVGWWLDPGLQALEQPRLRGQAVELMRQVVDVEAGEGKAIDAVAYGLGKAAETRHDERQACRVALLGGEIRAVQPGRG
jgi:hypothetical protein